MSRFYSCMFSQLVRESRVWCSQTLSTDLWPGRADRQVCRCPLCVNVQSNLQEYVLKGSQANQRHFPLTIHIDNIFSNYVHFLRVLLQFYGAVICFYIGCF